MRLKLFDHDVCVCSLAVCIYVVWYRVASNCMVRHVLYTDAHTHSQSECKYIQAQVTHTCRHLLIIRLLHQEQKKAASNSVGLSLVRVARHRQAGMPYNTYHTHTHTHNTGTVGRCIQHHQAYYAYRNYARLA